MFTSCREEFSDNPNHKLSFSTDTLRFDTVFSTITSPVKRIMVYNQNKEALRISQVSLLNGSNSVFQLNFNGENNPNHRFADKEIRGKDSIYIFVAVKVNELGVNSPVIIDETLRFETNGNVQDIILSTVGQDVIILRKDTIYDDMIFTSEKPYLIYDTVVVAPEKTLTVEAGAKLYFHYGAALYVHGFLKAEGTRDNPITMRGDRFDQMDQTVYYNEIAGQWSGVHLRGNKGKHIMKHVNMNSGLVGISILNTEESIIPSQVTSLDIINCKISNFLYYGLYVENSNVTVVNSEISNTSRHTVYLSGGEHTFIHTTIANYFNYGKNSVQSEGRAQGEGAKPSFLIMNLNKTVPMKTTLLNSVVMGSVETEFSLATRFPEQYNGNFKNSYIRRKNHYELPQFENIEWYKDEDIVFKNIYTDYEDELFRHYNFMPDSVSPVRSLGDPSVIVNSEYKEYLLEDLHGIARPTTDKPDAGAYQWVSSFN